MFPKAYQYRFAIFWRRFVDSAIYFPPALLVALAFKHASPAFQTQVKASAPAVLSLTSLWIILLTAAFYAAVRPVIACCKGRWPAVRFWRWLCDLVKDSQMMRDAGGVFGKMCFILLPLWAVGPLSYAFLHYALLCTLLFSLFFPGWMLVLHSVSASRIASRREVKAICLLVLWIVFGFILGRWGEAGISFVFAIMLLGFGLASALAWNARSMSSLAWHGWMLFGASVCTSSVVWFLSGQVPHGTPFKVAAVIAPLFFVFTAGAVPRSPPAYAVATSKPTGT